MKKKAILVPAALIVLGLLVGAVIILLLGKNPVTTYISFLQGAGLFPKANYAGGKSMLTDFSSLVNYWTPMIFASLAVTIAYRGGFFNIGVPGQMLTGGFLATIIIGYTEIAAPAAKVLVVLIAMVTGAVIGVLIGYLKYRFNIHEVVSAIMLNYIAQYVFAFFINTKYVDPISRQSRMIRANARLSLMETVIGDKKYDIPLGFILAIAAVFIVRYILNRTTFGFEIKAVGCSPKASKYSGINVPGIIIKTMAVSGALAGLAGAAYYLGYLGSIQPKVVPQMGYDAIAVSLLGNSNPIGVLAASFLICVIGRGSNYMSSSSGLDIEIAQMLTAILLLFSACSVFIQKWLSNRELRKKTQGGQKDE